MSPLGLHFTQHIVNVSWGGKWAFVATNSDAMFHGKIKAKEPPQVGKTVEWTELSMSQFNFTGETPYPGEKEIVNFRGLSSAVLDEKRDSEGNVIATAKSVFIACGQFSGADDSADTGSVFFISNDGRHWTKTLVVPDISWPAFPIPNGSEQISWAAAESVWDKNTKKFYIAGPASKSVKTDAGADVFRGEFMYSSSDGETWARVSENFIPDAGAVYSPDNWPSPSAILAHCTKPENAGPLPDGYQAYNSGTDNGTRMKSGGTFGYVTSVGVAIQPDVGGTEPPSTVTIQRNVAGVGPLPPPSSGTTSDGCWSVAYADSIWAAGVGRRGTPRRMGIDITIDAGTSWENVFGAEGKRPAFNIIGGKLVGIDASL